MASSGQASCEPIIGDPTIVCSGSDNSIPRSQTAVPHSWPIYLVPTIRLICNVDLTRWEEASRQVYCFQRNWSYSANDPILLPAFPSSIHWQNTYIIARASQVSCIVSNQLRSVWSGASATWLWCGKSQDHNWITYKNCLWLCLAATIRISVLQHENHDAVCHDQIGNLTLPVDKPIRPSVRMPSEPKWAFQTFHHS
jgi:hypothetical protein